MKRKICLILAVLMLLSTVALLSSCKGNGDDTANTTVTTVPTSGGDGIDTKLFEDLPTGSYEGYSFKFLNNISNYAITTIVPESTTDTVDAAIFARNSFVKEKLNIELEDIVMGYAAVKSTIASLTSSNDFEYDAVYNEGYLQLSLVQSGAYLPTEDLEDYLNFEKPWWFTDAMDSISVDGKSFAIFSDIQLMYYDSIWGMTFNHQDLIDNKQTFPYDLVRSGDWTLAEMEKILKATYQKPGSEHYGMVSHKDFISAMVASCDFELVSQDEDDILVIFEDESHFVEIYTDVMNLFFASNGPEKMNWIVPDYSSVAYTSGKFTSEEGFQRKFILGKSTFMAGTIGDIRQVRESEFAYGVLPFPKYNDDQEQYVSYIYQAAASLGVPANHPNLEQACVILENLAAYSYKLVRYEYYEVVVQGRTVRDNDSIEMLDIIFGHDEKGRTTFEIDTMYQLGLSNELRRSMSDAVTEVMVNLGSTTGAVAGEIEKIIEAYK